jgi:hypothetical protein
MGTTMVGACASTDPLKPNKTNMLFIFLEIISIALFLFLQRPFKIAVPALV